MSRMKNNIFANFFEEYAFSYRYSGCNYEAAEVNI